MKHTHNQKSELNRCDFCHAEEGKPRIVGQFIVSLRTVDVFGSKKLACQSCARKNEEIQQSRKMDLNMGVRDHGVLNFKRFISFMFNTCFVLMLLSYSLFAQPPGLPSTGPAEAPIDGGLGLLAAAGGAYALKKLRDRKREDLQE